MDIINITDVTSGFKEPTAANKEQKVAPPSKEMAFLFVSFDLYNFTAFKTFHKACWSTVIQVFWEIVNESFKCVDFWKFNGDEILFKKRITSLLQIKDIIEEAYRCMERLETAFSKQLKNDVVYIKSGVWLANVKDTIGEKVSMHDYEKIAKQQDEVLSWNYLIRSKINNQVFEDFIGINIDEGFRLRSCATRSRFVVDPKIAYMFYSVLSKLCCKDGLVENAPNAPISECLDSTQANVFIDCVNDFATNATNEKITAIKRFAKNLALVGFTPCKGVWNNRLYPIVWYSNNWNREKDRVIYDDRFIDNFVSDIVESISIQPFPPQGTTKSVPIQFTFKGLSTLKTVFEQVEVEKNFYEILKLIKVDAVSEDAELGIVEQPKLNYVVVCVTPDKQKALIFKRHEKREHLKGVWDFGTSRHTTMDCIAETIVHNYLVKFGINIKIVRDNGRNQPIKPFAFCQIPRHGDKQNVILCFALIESLENGNGTTDVNIIAQVRDKLNVDIREKYQDVALISTEDIDLNQTPPTINLKNNNNQILVAKCLTESQVEMDAICLQRGEDQPHIENFATVNAALSIKQALEFFQNNYEE